MSLLVTVWYRDQDGFDIEEGFIAENTTTNDDFFIIYGKDYVCYIPAFVIRKVDVVKKEE